LEKKRDAYDADQHDVYLSTTKLEVEAFCGVCDDEEDEDNILTDVVLLSFARCLLLLLDA
jgi:hypothetical protein